MSCETGEGILYHYWKLLSCRLGPVPSRLTFTIYHNCIALYGIKTHRLQTAISKWTLLNFVAPRYQLIDFMMQEVSELYDPLRIYKQKRVSDTISQILWYQAMIYEISAASDGSMQGTDSAEILSPLKLHFTASLPGCSP